MKITVIDSFVTATDKGFIAPAIGDTIEVDEKLGEGLVNAGLAEKVKAKKKKAENVTD